MSDETILRLRLEGQRAVDAGLDETALKLTGLGDAAAAVGEQADRVLGRMASGLSLLGAQAHAGGRTLLGTLVELERAGAEFTRQQEQQTAQWVLDGEALRAHQLMLRDLRREYEGLVRLLVRARATRFVPGAARGARSALGPNARGLPLNASLSRAYPRGRRGARGARTSVRAPRVVGLAAAGRVGARAYARAFRAALGRSPVFRDAGRAAGRRMAAATAATAGAQVGRSFAARRGRWLAAGHRTGITIGTRAGVQTAITTADRTAQLIGVTMSRHVGHFGAVGQAIGNVIGQAAGNAAVARFAAVFNAGIAGVIANAGGGGKGKDDDGGGGGGLFGWVSDAADTVGGVLDSAPGKIAGIAADGGGWAADKAKQAGGTVARLAPGLRKLPAVGNAADWFSFLNETRKIGPLPGDFDLGSWGSSALGGTPIGTGLDVYDLLGRPIGKAGQDLIWYMKHPAGYARGGRVRSSGISIVGERGPEIVRLPSGSNVVPAHRTRELLEQERSATRRVASRRDLHVHQHIDGREIARTVVRNIDNTEAFR